MRLIEHDEPPVPAVLALEQIDIRRAQQQVLQHRVVGEQQVRRAVPHLLPAEQLAGQPGLPGVELLEQRRTLARPFRGISRIVPERDVRESLENLAQPAHLVVGERVHRVQQQRAHPRPEDAGGVFCDELRQHRKQEALGLPRSGPGCDHEVAARGGLADRLLLMQVQRAVQRQGRPAEPGECRVKHSVRDQFAQAGAGPVRRRRLEDRPLGQQRAALDGVPQRSGQRRLTYGQQRPQVPAVGGAQLGAGGDQVHFGSL